MGCDAERAARPARYPRIGPVLPKPSRIVLDGDVVMGLMGINGEPRPLHLPQGFF
jgi:hypothetical protein